MTTLPAANLSGGIEDAGPPALICTGCGTANDLIIEAIEAAVPAVPGHVSLEYTCSACGSFSGHDASVQQVATLFNAGASVPGVLHFGRYFIHCGEPMEETGEVIPCLDGPVGGQGGPSAAISIRTRLLKCHCGFQLGVPQRAILAVPPSPPRHRRYLFRLRSWAPGRGPCEAGHLRGRLGKGYPATRSFVTKEPALDPPHSHRHRHEDVPHPMAAPQCTRTEIMGQQGHPGAKPEVRTVNARMRSPSIRHGGDDPAIGHIDESRGRIRTQLHHLIQGSCFLTWEECLDTSIPAAPLTADSPPTAKNPAPKP